MSSLDLALLRLLMFVTQRHSHGTASIALYCVKVARQPALRSSIRLLDTFFANSLMVTGAAHKPERSRGLTSAATAVDLATKVRRAC